VGSTLFFLRATFAQVAPANNPPTFYRDVLPILQEHCQSCHRAGGISPMAFETARQTQPYAAAIHQATQNKSMPPWFADANVGRFSNDPSLTAEQIGTLAAWANAQAPVGEERDAPPARMWAESWSIPQPDLVLKMPQAAQLPANGDIEYTYEIVPTHFSQDRWVQMAEVLPALRSNVHHAVVYVRPPDSKWLRHAPVGVPFTASTLTDPEDRRGAHWTDSEILLVYAPGSSPDMWPANMAFYDKNKSNYQVPERRVVRYALVDVNQIRQGIQVSDDQLKVQYQKNIQDYQVPNRVHVEHILLMTVGNKTDAEVEEIKKKAEDVLKQARSGAKFEDLAKKYTEDPGTKDKGGDLGWLVQGQTVPEFEKAAFSLQKGQISDLVRTQYGFHIIKAIDKETAHTKSFDEVKESLRAPLLLSQADKQASDTADQMSAAIRQSNKTSLDDLAKQYHLTVSETRPVSATDPLIELANSKDAKDAIFRQRAGDLSLPIRTDRGYVVLLVKEIQPAHPGTLEEVRDKVVADLKRQKSIELARSKAEDLIKRVKAGEKFDPAAKGLGLDPKASDLLARNGTIPGAASGKQLTAAFNLNAGEVGAPLTLGQNWLVYQVAEKQEPNPADFEKQKKDLTEEALQAKRSLAYEAFRTALDERLKQEGKLKLMPEKMKNFGSLG